MKAVRVVDTDCELCKGRGVIVLHRLLGAPRPGRQWVTEDCSCVYYAEFSFAEHHKAGKKMLQRLEFSSENNTD